MYTNKDIICGSSETVHYGRQTEVMHYGEHESDGAAVYGHKHVDDHTTMIKIVMMTINIVTINTTTIKIIMIMISTITINTIMIPRPSRTTGPQDHPLHLKYAYVLQGTIGPQGNPDHNDDADPSADQCGMCCLYPCTPTECEWLESLYGDISDKPISEQRQLRENVKALWRRFNGHIYHIYYFPRGRKLIYPGDYLRLMLFFLH